MTEMPDVKLRALVNFPVSVTGRTAMNVVKVNGRYYLDFDVSGLVQNSNISAEQVDQSRLVVWNSVTDAYETVPFALAATAGVASLDGHTGALDIGNGLEFTGDTLEVDIGDGLVFNSGAIEVDIDGVTDSNRYNFLSVLTPTEQADVLTGTNSIDLTAKMQAFISTWATDQPGAVLDFTALHGIVTLTGDPFDGLHTADITIKTGHVILEKNFGLGQIVRPSKLLWLADGTEIRTNAEIGGIPSADPTAQGMVVTWVGETTCTGTIGSADFDFASVEGLHVGSRVAIAGGFLEPSMVLTLTSTINASATSFAVDENTSTYIGGAEIYVRIDDETILCSVPFGSNHTVNVITRGANGSVAASHTSGADVIWALALTANVIAIDATTVTLDAPATQVCANATVRFGAFRSHIEGNMLIDGLHDRYFSSTVTITHASPAVITWTTDDDIFEAYGLTVGRAFRLETTGTLPTGFSPDVTYFIKTVIDVPTRKFTASATSGGVAINTSSDGSGVHTGAADRPYAWQGLAFSLARECNIRGKVSVRNMSHGGILCHGTADCDIQLDEILHCARPIVGIGAGIWIFGSNDRTIIRARRVHDTNGGFFIDDKTSNSSNFGLDAPNIRCQIFIDQCTGQVIGGGITCSRYCTAVIGYLDAANQGVSIDNNEGQSSVPTEDNCIHNTIIVYAMSSWLPPAGDSITGTNVIYLYSAEMTRTVALGSTTVLANNTSDENMAFSGVKAGAHVTVTPLFDPPNGLIISHGRSAVDDFVKVRLGNVTAGGIDAIGNYLIKVRNQ